jgi:hypothetical protein
MAENRTVVDELQGQVLETVRRSQEVTLDVIRSWADALQPLTAQLPALPAGVVSPQEVVSGAYDFAQQLLATQRKFAEDVIHATAPLAVGWSEPAARKAGSAHP